jgi:Protein of unknown function (DUF664)
MDRSPEPRASDERDILIGWLSFHRDALAAKCEGLTPEQLATMSVPPSGLTLLGLVRHLTEMEHVYLVHALAGEGKLSLVYCTDDNPDGDIAGLDPAMAGPSMQRWMAERARADELIWASESLDSVAGGNRFTIRWNLIKMIQEYARHNGHADLIRESIDGVTGE